MDRANPKLKLTKTDLCRLLNDNADRWPELIPLRNTYMEKCDRARKHKVSQFGFWLRDNKRAIFDRVYRQALKEPNLLKEIYADDASSGAEALPV